MNDGHHLGFRPDPNPPHLRQAVCAGECTWSVPAPGTGYARGAQQHRQHLAEVIGPHYAVIVVAPGASRIECAGCTWTGPNGDAHDEHRADLAAAQADQDRAGLLRGLTFAVPAGLAMWAALGWLATRWW